MARAFAVWGVLVVAVSAAMAQEPQVIDDSQDWWAATFEEQGSGVWFIASVPKKEEGDYTRRGLVYVQVTRREALGCRDVVSFEAGYPYKQDSTPVVTIDGEEEFELFTHPDTPETAWAPDDVEDELVEAMRAGVQMVVRGTSSRGTLTTDTYSLLGFTAMHETIAEACPQP